MKTVVLIVCCAACLLCLTAFLNFGSAPGDDEKNTVLRMIGHRLLAQAGDHTSVLPPVEKTDANAYKIQFAAPLSFIPDSLVNTVSKAFDRAAINTPYMVKVVNTATRQIVYSYEINNKADKDIIPCIGRNQPVAKYYVEIVLKPAGTFAGVLQAGWLPVAGVLMSLASIGMMLFYRKKNGMPGGPVAGALRAGGYTLHPGRDVLQHGSTTTKLTVREIKALTLFMQQPNTIFERGALVNTLWGDEGVIVGARSLDVFISKLRKKMSANPGVGIVNVHGVGYKLQVDEE